MSGTRTGFADANPRAAAAAGDDNGVDVQIDDDGAHQVEGQRQPPAAPHRAADATPADRTGDEFGRRANRRISSLLGRAKSAEDRALALQAENEALRRGALQTDQARLTAEEQRILAQKDQAHRDLVAARDAGDTAAEMKAHGLLTQLEVQSSRVGEFKAQVQQAVARAGTAPAAAPAPTEATANWMAENEWFNADSAMTHTALGFDRDAKRLGLKVDTPEYFAHIDKKMRAAFPEYFDEGEGARSPGNGAADGEEVELEPPARAVPRAPAAAAAPRRNAGAPPPGGPGKRTIRLTVEELEVARSLKLSPQQYAASKQARLRGEGR